MHVHNWHFIQKERYCPEAVFKVCEYDFDVKLKELSFLPRIGNGIGGLVQRRQY
jgi:hypothetical protein